MLRYDYTAESIPEGATVSDNTIEDIRRDTIGSIHFSGLERNLITSPLDRRNRSIIYADWTASGRSLQSIESFMINRVLPWYGNTHSVSSGTARQTTHYREEARHIIRNYFNCTEANAVMFVGAGVTGAMQKFMALLEEGIRERHLGSREASHIGSFLVEDRWGSLVCSLCDVRVKNEAAYRSHCGSAMHHHAWLEKFHETDFNRNVSQGADELKLHIILDSMSHHSSLLPFRELARRHASEITLTSIDLDDLEMELEKIPKKSIPVGIFCAMSNITGEGPSPERLIRINELIHAQKGLVAWDLATFASHKKFDMNPVGRPSGYSDFAFVSTHKLIGGPGASGLLLARREWLKNRIPTSVGGGVVFFASAKEESYIQNSEQREEAGTPDILGCIRAGLVFRLHSQIWGLAEKREEKLVSLVRNRFFLLPKVVLLSSAATPVISFNIRFDDCTLLHHDFVVAVLNDLFGVQARGGCACAGPLAQSLLGLDEKKSHEFHMCLQQSGQEIFRPGFARISLHWSMSEEEVSAIADAVEWIAANGWKLLAAYTVDLQTGEWKHRDANYARERVWMSNYDFFSINPTQEVSEKTQNIVDLSDLVLAANKALENANLDLVREARLDERFADLVWFALPSDSKRTIRQTPRITCPPKRLSSEVSFVANIIDHPAKKKVKFQTPKKLRTLVTCALADYAMLKPDDKVLIGISGGKDSLSLLHLLLDIQRKCPFKFRIACATVDPQVPEYQPRPLIQYINSLGVEYHYLSSPIVEIAKTAMKGKQSICAFCSRMKRGMLYRCMRDNGYNVLALGQHLDDLAESFLMSSFRNGALRTMKANYLVKEKDLRVIRPLIYVREKMTTEFANDAQLPVIRDNCPACFAAPKERHRVKMLLSNEEFENPHLFASMLQAMKPLIGISSALSTRQLILAKQFPIANLDEEEDQGAEDVLLPCADGLCPILNSEVS